MILSALYAISSDPDQEKDLRDNINSTLNSISGNQKDRSLLSISYANNIEVNKIKKSDIGYCTVKLLEDKNLINEEIFNFLREDKSCSFQLLKLKEELTETEKKYRKYRVNNEPELFWENKGYYIARNWGKDNIQNLIKKFTQKFPSLKYKVHK